MKLKLLITGGGTGGHLFPAIAVADELLALYPESEVMFIGTGREVERHVLASKPYIKATLKSSGLKGISWSGRLVSLARLPIACWHAWRMLKEFRPQIVLGVGGYVTAPVLLAARLQGLLTCIHEQNSIPGLANRWLGRLVELVFVSLPGSESHFSSARVCLTGNPLRPELVAAADKHREERKLRSVLAGRAEAEAGRKTILVLGGSQGAHQLNLLMLGAARLMQEEGLRFRLIHQSGKADVEMLRDGYSQAGIDARVEPFIDDMAQAYCQADMVLSRAGATTLAELVMFGKPAVLVPYPYAADDHQRHNAMGLVEKGAALIRIEAELSVGALAAELKELIADEARLQEMSDRSALLAKPLAARTIIEMCRARLQK